MTSYRSIAAAAGAALCLAAVAAPAQAQTSAASRTAALMDALRGEILRREQLAPGNEGQTVFSAEIGSLYADEDREVHLVRGWSGIITVVGFCDQYCSDLDLYVTDDLGNAVATDVSINATPVVTFRSQAERTYRLRALMYGCQEGIVCKYGVAAFSR